MKLSRDGKISRLVTKARVSLMQVQRHRVMYGVADAVVVEVSSQFVAALIADFARIKAKLGKRWSSGQMINESKPKPEWLWPVHD